MAQCKFNVPVAGHRVRRMQAVQRRWASWQGRGAKDRGRAVAGVALNT